MRRIGKVPHAIERALERYGLRLSFSDLDRISEECAKGYGRLSYMEDQKEKHIVHYLGASLVVVYIPEVDASHPRGRVVTILPPEAATSSDIYAKSRVLKEVKIKPAKSLRKYPKKLSMKLRNDVAFTNRIKRERREWVNKHGKS